MPCIHCCTLITPCLNPTLGPFARARRRPIVPKHAKHTRISNLNQEQAAQHCEQTGAKLCGDGGGGVFSRRRRGAGRGGGAAARCGGGVAAAAAAADHGGKGVVAAEAGGEGGVGALFGFFLGAGDKVDG